MNRITLYEGNSANIDCTINLDDLTGYEGTWYVKKKPTDTTFEMEITGTTSGSTISFRLEESDTSITPGIYYYEVRIVNIVDTYSVSYGELVISDSLPVDST